MLKHIIPRIALLFVLPNLAFAAPIIYTVAVDTSSVSGTSGALDFNFNPGPFATQSAFLQILGFSSDGVLAGACPCATGDVTGQLPSTVSIDNGSGFNDYFDDFTFGLTLSFNLSFYGPALSSPDGASTSGSTFAFSMFSDPLGTIPILTSDTIDGFAFTTNVNLDGSTTVTSYSPQTVVSTQSASPAPVSPVPEPSTLSFMLLAGVVSLSFLLRRMVTLT